MSVAWSRRKPEEPDPPVIVTVAGIDPANPDATVVSYREVQPSPFAPPDELQNDVIEPTAVFKPWLPGKYWDGVEITVEYYD
jgi:hypothetical protein